MEPRCVLIKPVIAFSSVDFPAPLAPMMKPISPLGTSIDTPLSAGIAL
jgi:hypothetical protein